MPHELKDRKTIGAWVIQCGWVIQDYENLTLGESLEDVIDEFPIGKDHADYLFFIDRVAVGVIEAKKFVRLLAALLNSLKFI